MLGRLVSVSQTGVWRVETALDPARQPFLGDHRIDGTPVLPGVMGIEAFAELATLAAPGRRVTAIEDVEFLAPVKFYRDQPRTLTIEARLRADGADLVADCRLLASRTLPGQDEPQVTVHFTGRVRLSRGDLVQEPRGARPAPHNGHLVEADAIYRVYFHGPAYQVLDTAWPDGEATVGLLHAPLPPDHVPEEPALVFDPRLIELCFQTAGIREIGRSGRMSLPHRVARIARGAAPGADVTYAVVRDAGVGFDADVIDERGRLVLHLDGYRTIEVPGALEEPLVAPLRI